MIPVLGGIAGGTAAVLAGRKWNTHPGLVAAGTAAAGLTAMTMAKQHWLRQAGAGMVVGAAVVGAVPLVVGAFEKTPQHAQTHLPVRPSPGSPQRMAEGDGYVTRGELNDALGKLADTHKETQKQQTCDLLTALRDEIRKVVAEGPNGPGLPSAENAHPPALPSAQPSHTYPFNPRTTNNLRGAYGDDYTRNAYGDDIRDAEADDYTRNAYGDDIRDAEADEYTRNAYGDDMRDAFVDAPPEYRDADDYRDADGYERDADGYETRDAYGDDERNAARVRRGRYMPNVDTGDDSGLTDEQIAQQQAQMSGGSSM